MNKITVDELEYRVRILCSEIPGFTHSSAQMEKCYTRKGKEEAESWNVTLFVIIDGKLRTCGPCTSSIQQEAIEKAFFRLAQKLSLPASTLAA